MNVLGRIVWAVFERLYGLSVTPELLDRLDQAIAAQAQVDFRER